MPRKKILLEEINTLDVSEEELFKRFCSERELSKRSIELYKSHLQLFSNFTFKTLEELIEEAEDEEDMGIRLRRRKIVEYLIDFKNHLKGYAPSTQKQIMISIRAFYNHYDIQLPKSKQNTSRKSKKLKNPQTIESLPTMDEIKLFLEHCNEVYKFVVLIGICSGMGRAEISNLTFEHLYQAFSLLDYPSNIPELVKKLKEKRNYIPTWHITRVKTGHNYYTFSSPESTDRLIQYLEKLNYKFPEYIPEPKDALIRGLSTNKHAIPTNIGTYLYNVNKVNGFRKYNDRYVCLPHGFRRFFASTLEKNKIPHLTTRWLMGHLFDDTTGAYFKIDPEDAKEDYLDVVKYLSTNEVEVMKITTEAYEEVKSEIEELKKRLWRSYFEEPKLKSTISVGFDKKTKKLSPKETKKEIGPIFKK